MTSALTTATEAAQGLVVPSGSLAEYYPMEETTGTTASGVIAGTTLTATGGATPGGSAFVAGAAGCWNFSGATNSYLARTIPSGADPVKLSSSMAVGAFFNLSAVPAAATKLIDYVNAWSLTIQSYPYLGGAYNAGTTYQPGACCVYNSISWMAMQVTEGVTPGTNSAYWVGLCSVNWGGYLTENAVNSVTSPFLIPVGIPFGLLTGFSGSEFSTYLSGAITGQVFPIGAQIYSATANYVTNQVVAHTSGVWQAQQANGPSTAVVTPGTNTAYWEPYTAGTDTVPTPSSVALGVGGLGSGIGGTGASITGGMCGLSFWSCPPNKALSRYLWNAAVTNADLPPAVPSFLDLTQDVLIPQITAEASTFLCPACGRYSRTNEGYRLINSKKYHRDCYEGHAVNTTPAMLSGAATLNQFADRAARIQQWCLDVLVHRFDNFKSVYMSSLSGGVPPFIVMPGTTVNNFSLRFQLEVGCAAAVAARYSGSQKNGRLVAIASAIMETAIACQWGAPSNWLAPGYESIVGPSYLSGLSGFSESANWIGAYAAPGDGWSNTPGNTNWSFQYAAFIVLCLKKYVSSSRPGPGQMSTLERWMNSAIAGGESAWSGSFTVTTNGAPAFPQYVNGNWSVRTVLGFFYLWLLTRDQIWYQRYQISLEWMIAPYGEQVNWLGAWNPLTNYHQASDGSAASGYTPAGAIAGVADAVRLQSASYPSVYTGSSTSAWICTESIAGNASNPSPASDPTHWTRLENTLNNVNNIGNYYNWDGMGVQGLGFTDGGLADGSDCYGWLTEWNGNGGTAQGGGPSGSALYLQPGFSPDYTTLQVQDLTMGYFVSVAAGQPEPRFKFLINMLMNQASRYPYGAAATGGSPTNPLNNPQSTFFNNSIVVSGNTVFTESPSTWQYAWATDRQNQASGGYSTRHSLVDGFRSPGPAMMILSGLRSDLPASLAWGQFGSLIEPNVRSYVGQISGAESVAGGCHELLSPFLIASSRFPGF